MVSVECAARVQGRTGVVQGMFEEAVDSIFQTCRMRASLGMKCC